MCNLKQKMSGITVFLSSYLLQGLTYILQMMIFAEDQIIMCYQISLFLNKSRLPLSWYLLSYFDKINTGIRIQMQMFRHYTIALLNKSNHRRNIHWGVHDYVPMWPKTKPHILYTDFWDDL